MPRRFRLLHVATAAIIAFCLLPLAAARSYELSPHQRYLVELSNAALILRFDVLSDPSKDNDALEKLISMAALPVTNLEAAYIIQVFFTGALPIINPKAEQTDKPVLAYYAPFSDVGLITTWERKGSTFAITSADLVTGEALAGSRATDISPRWKQFDSLATGLMAVTGSTYDASMGQNLSGMITAKSSRTMESKAIALGRLAVSLQSMTEAMPCHDVFAKIGRTVGSLKAGAQQNNITSGTEDEAVFTVGGLKVANTAVRVYSMGLHSNIYFVAIVPSTADCVVSNVVGFDVMQDSKVLPPLAQ